MRDHYRSHQLSIWLSLIPRLTIPSEIEEKERLQQQKSFSASKEASEDSDEEQNANSNAHLLRHHLLVDHGNPNSYEGEVKGNSGPELTAAATSNSGKWSRLERANVSEALDWQQSLLYGRLVHAKAIRGGSGSSNTNNARSSNAAALGNEQFAGRRAEAEKRGEIFASGANNDPSLSAEDQSQLAGGKSGQPSGSQMNMDDLVHTFADNGGQEMDKNLLYVSGNMNSSKTTKIALVSK